MEGAFHLQVKRDSEVSSVSFDGLIPPQSLLPSYWEGASRDPAALASSKQNYVLLLHNAKYHLFFTPDSPGKNREKFFYLFFFSLSLLAPFMSPQTSLLLLTLVARCLFVHLRKWFLIFVEIPLFLSSQCCCAFQSQCRVRRNTAVLSQMLYKDLGLGNHQIDVHSSCAVMPSPTWMEKLKIKAF